MSDVLKKAHRFFYYVHIKAHRVYIEALKKGIVMKDYFEEIVGYEDIKEQLKMTADMLKNPAKYQAFGLKYNNGIVLEGVPGTGKTTLAWCFIKATERKCFVCRKKMSDGLFLQNIVEVFEQAVREAPSVILLDDMDKFAEKDCNKSNAEEFATIQACIDEIKEKDVFIIATANDLEAVPDSLLRDGRLGKIITVGAPTESERKIIIEHFLKKIKNTEELDIESISRMLYGYSCAELEVFLQSAAMRAAYNNKELITMDDIVEVCLEKVFHLSEYDTGISEDTLKKVAYHEAGHIIISELVDPQSVSIASIRKTRSGKLGFVRYTTIPDAEYTYEYYQNQIKEALAGKATTEVVFGEVDVGANNDLHHAFDIATKLVDNYCSFGFQNWIDDKNNAFVSENRNREMASVMERNYMATKKMLVDNRRLLDKVANALLEKTTLIYSDIQGILSESL